VDAGSWLYLAVAIPLAVVLLGSAAFKCLIPSDPDDVTLGLQHLAFASVVLVSAIVVIVRAVSGRDPIRTPEAQEPSPKCLQNAARLEGNRAHASVETFWRNAFSNEELGEKAERRRGVR
jgi:hypothetical protein